MKEYLATLEATAWGAATEVVPKFVSPSDSGAGGPAHKRASFFAYPDNYLIDMKFGIILDVEASRAPSHRVTEKWSRIWANPEPVRWMQLARW